MQLTVFCINTDIVISQFRCISTTNDFKFFIQCLVDNCISVITSEMQAVVHSRYGFFYRITVSVFRFINDTIFTSTSTCQAISTFSRCNRCICTIFTTYTHSAVSTVQYNARLIICHIAYGYTFKTCHIFIQGIRESSACLVNSEVITGTEFYFRFIANFSCCIIACRLACAYSTALCHPAEVRYLIFYGHYTSIYRLDLVFCRCLTAHRSLSTSPSLIR